MLCVRSRVALDRSSEMVNIGGEDGGREMSLPGCDKPRQVFVALPFEVRDKIRNYRTTLALLEDRYNIKIVHGDHTTDASAILDRATELLRQSRVCIFDMTGFKPNVVFEFGYAKGAGLKNVYAMRHVPAFGRTPIPTMMNNIDCPSYRNAKQLKSVLERALERHFWPSDRAFTEGDLPWLREQVRELTYPACETDKVELEKATGISGLFVTQAIRSFVEQGAAVAVTVGPVPRYQFGFDRQRGLDGAGLVKPGTAETANPAM